MHRSLVAVLVLNAARVAPDDIMPGFAAPRERPPLSENPGQRPKKTAGTGRFRLVVGWGLLGFWRFMIGLCSRKHAIARLGPRRPALGVVGAGCASVGGWFSPI
jgi:hypothetical protein